MGKGIDLCREHAPEHAALLDNLKDQLLICFLKRLGGKLAMSVSEVDATGRYMLAFRIDSEKVFHFELQEKA